MGTVYSITDKGKTRINNEDAVFAIANEQGALLVLADGIGGHDCGEWASGMAVKIFENSFFGDCADADKFLLEIFEKINGFIFAKAPGGSKRAGTTLVAALVRKDTCTVCNVGDSRMYFARNKILRRVTRDDSWVTEMVESGAMSEAEAEESPNRNIITQAIGTNEIVRPKLYHMDLNPGDMLLLTSDGLHGVLSLGEMAAILFASDNLSEIGGNMVRRANELDGKDNISAVLYRHGV